jgi:hypothetical protein
MRPAMLIWLDRRAPLVPIGQRLALEDEALDGRGRAVRTMGVLVPAMAELRGAVQVGDVQEGRALQADVDEGRLHAGQHAHDLAEVDVADQAPFQRALDVQLLHRAVFNYSHPRLLRGPVDQDVFHLSSLNADACRRPQRHASKLKFEFP